MQEGLQTQPNFVAEVLIGIVTVILGTILKEEIYTPIRKRFQRTKFEEREVRSATRVWRWNVEDDKRNRKMRGGVPFKTIECMEFQMPVFPETLTLGMIMDPDEMEEFVGYQEAYGKADNGRLYLCKYKRSSEGVNFLHSLQEASWHQMEQRKREQHIEITEAMRSLSRRIL